MGLTAADDIGQSDRRKNCEEMAADGTSGIFVSDLATLPEPSSLLLVATATLALLLRTRRS